VARHYVTVDGIELKRKLKDISMTITLADDWRVRPIDALQWVIEHRDQKGRRSRLELAGERWRAMAYCRTRDGLYCALSRFNAGVDVAPLAVLPERFE
jgi:hypothetical protein